MQEKVHRAALNHDRENNHNIGSLSQRERIQPNRAAIDARRLKSWNVAMEGRAHNAVYWTGGRCRLALAGSWSK